MSEQLKSMLSVTEGWMAQKSDSTRRYHFIRETMSLCGGLGFYRGDLVPHVAGTPRGNKDCAKCYRLAPKSREVKR